MQSNDQMVRFEVQGEAYALPFDAVTEVAAPGRIYIIPLLPVGTAGVATLRGEPILVFNAGSLFEREPLAKPGHMLVLEGDRKRVGLLVDHVERVERMAPELIDADMDPALSQGPDFVTWRRVEEGRVGFVDPSALLSRAEDSLRAVPQPTAEIQGENSCPSAF